MPDFRTHSATSNLVRFSLKDYRTGYGITGITSGTSGLYISTICDNESSPTVYAYSGNIEDISVLGTFSAPTAGKCRFKQVNSSYHPGLYEFQFDDSRFAYSNAKRMVISVKGAANLLDADYEMQLTQTDLYLSPAIKKGTAVANFPFYMVQSADHNTPATGLTITAERSLDGGAFAACTNAAVEVANGNYKINLSSTDTAGTIIILRFTATGADQRIMFVITTG